MAKTGLFDLERHFAFYGAYHSDPVNSLIHMVLIWPMFFTTLLLFHFIPPFFKTPYELPLGLVVNFGLLFTLVYCVYYVSLDKKAGLLGAVLCFLCWVSAGVLGNHLGYSLSWKVVLGVQVFSWTCQILGHRLFEKRSPAIIDNLLQALLQVPFFILLEVLQSFFGYEPYPGFKKNVKAKLDAERKAWEDRKAKKAS